MRSPLAHRRYALSRIAPRSAKQVWRMGRYVADSANDAVDSVRHGRRPALSPPLRLARLAGGPCFREVGEEFFRYLVALAGLEREHVVLDVGSGIGRIAVPLTSYLDPDARYYGFDIVPRAVRWCQRNISEHHPNFEFRLADVRNELYNPRGTIPAEEYAFPYPSSFADCVVATSLLTHMPFPATAHYLSEIARVLKPGGQGLLTFFLLNDGSRESITAGNSTMHFNVDCGNYSLESLKDPGYAVAFAESVVRDLFDEHGLRIVEPIHFGSWSGKKEFLSFQDVVIVRRDG